VSSDQLSFSYYICLYGVADCRRKYRAAFADSGHARIVRLSLVQGDVRFARDVKRPALRFAWRLGSRGAELADPAGIRGGDGQRPGRVEFENGAMAFLAENTVLGFTIFRAKTAGLPHG
jgi:hypothetical protein